MSTGLTPRGSGELLFSATLTMPPRLSELTNNVGRSRVASAKAREWRRANEFKVLFKVKGPIQGPVHVWIRLGMTAKQQAGDVANREKAVTDLLVYCKVLKDDSVRSGVLGNHQVFDPAVPEGQCAVEVRTP